MKPLTEQIVSNDTKLILRAIVRILGFAKSTLEKVLRGEEP